MLFVPFWPLSTSSQSKSKGEILGKEEHLCSGPGIGEEGLYSSLPEDQKHNLSKNINLVLFKCRFYFVASERVDDQSGPEKVSKTCKQTW